MRRLTLPEAYNNLSDAEGWLYEAASCDEFTPTTREKLRALAKEIREQMDGYAEEIKELEDAEMELEDE